MESFTIGDKIGQGTFGSVFECSSSSGETLAVKMTKPNNRGIGSLLEVSIMKTYIHPNINSCRAAICKDSHFFILQDKAVCDLNNSVTAQIPSVSQAVEWFSQILQGLRVLHSESIIHCDIKPDNILVYADGIVKLTDFTHSVICKSRKFSHKVGTIHFAAPEILMRRSWGKKIDIWSLGCTYYFVLTAQRLVPSYGKSDSDAILASIKAWRGIITPDESVKPIILSDLYFRASYNIQQLVMEMLNFHPRDRPSVKSLSRNTLIGARQKCFVFNSPGRVEKDSTTVSLMEHITSNYQVVDIASRIHKRISFDRTLKESLPRLLGLEVCIWIAHKVIFGYPPLEPIFKSQLHDILDAEIRVCTYLGFRLHATS